MKSLLIFLALVVTFLGPNHSNATNIKPGIGGIYIINNAPKVQKGLNSGLNCHTHKFLAEFIEDENDESDDSDDNHEEKCSFFPPANNNHIIATNFFFPVHSGFFDNRFVYSPGLPFFLLHRMLRI